MFLVHIKWVLLTHLRPTFIYFIYFLTCFLVNERNMFSNNLSVCFSYVPYPSILLFSHSFLPSLYVHSDWDDLDKVQTPKINPIHRILNIAFSLSLSFSLFSSRFHYSFISFVSYPLIVWYFFGIYPICPLPNSIATTTTTTVNCTKRTWTILNLFSTKVEHDLVMNQTQKNSKKTLDKTRREFRVFLG